MFSCIIVFGRDENKWEELLFFSLQAENMNKLIQQIVKIVKLVFIT